MLPTSVLLVFLLAQPSSAKVGVGINLAKIKVNQPLYSGGSYNITKMTVLNTGTEPGWYRTDISYLERQKELRPPKSWYHFSPKNFYLKPGQAKEVQISLSIPISAQAGKYFALVRGRPTAKKGSLTIGVAAAAKMSFTVKSSSLWWSILNWISSRLKNYAPYSYIVLAIVGLAIILIIARRYLSISIKLEKKGKS